MKVSWQLTLITGSNVTCTQYYFRFGLELNWQVIGQVREGSVGGFGLYSIGQTGNGIISITSCLLSWNFNKDCQSLDWSHSNSFQSKNNVIQYFGGNFPRANPAWKSLRTIGNYLVRPPANVTIRKIYSYILLMVLDPK